jgi:hypothetical protein
MKYLEKVREMEKHFKGYSVQHIPRNDNNEAEKLAKAATQNQVMPPDVFFEIIKEPSFKDLKPKAVNIVETRDWRDEIMAYLRGHCEPKLVITTSPTLDMKGFLATRFLLLKSNKKHVLTFKILAQVLVGLSFTKLAI